MLYFFPNYYRKTFYYTCCTFRRFMTSSVDLTIFSVVPAITMPLTGSSLISRSNNCYVRRSLRFSLYNSTRVACTIVSLYLVSIYKKIKFKALVIIPGLSWSLKKLNYSIIDLRVCFSRFYCSICQIGTIKSHKCLSEVFCNEIAKYVLLLGIRIKNSIEFKLWFNGLLLILQYQGRIIYDCYSFIIRNMQFVIT